MLEASLWIATVDASRRAAELHICNGDKRKATTVEGKSYNQCFFAVTDVWFSFTGTYDLWWRTASAGSTVMPRGCSHCCFCYYGVHELIHPLSVFATTMNAQSTDSFLTIDGDEASGRDSTASVGGQCGDPPRRASARGWVLRGRLCARS